MSALGDATDAGVLLAWAARPREVPAKHEEYHRVVTRYRSDPDFAALVDAMFSGAGLNLVVDERDGALVVAEAHSPLRVTVSGIMKRASQVHRAVVGGVILMIARIAFPEPTMLDSPDRLPVFTVRSIVDALDRTTQAHSEASQDDGVVDAGQLEVWRQWQALRPGRPNAQRRSASDRAGAVNKVCRFLQEAGYLTFRGDTDGGTWQARSRFRRAAAALCADSDLYRQINQLDADAPEESR